MLDGFEPVILSNMHGPSVSITKNGITFGKATIEAFQKPRKDYVLLKVNRDVRQFVIIQAARDEVGAMPFTSANPKTQSVRWNNKELLRLIAGLMGWKLKECSGYRVPGKYLRDEKAVLFDLNDAIPIT